MHAGMAPRAPRTTAPAKSDVSASSAAASPGSYPPAGYGTGNGVAAGTGAGAGTAKGCGCFGKGRRAHGPQGAMTAAPYDVESPPVSQQPPSRVVPTDGAAVEVICTALLVYGVEGDEKR